MKENQDFDNRDLQTISIDDYDKMQADASDKAHQQ
jgi:hypothetical protein